MLPTRDMLDNLRNTGSMMDNGWKHQKDTFRPLTLLPIPKPATLDLGTTAGKPDILGAWPFNRKW